MHFPLLILSFPVPQEFAREDLKRFKKECVDELNAITPTILQPLMRDEEVSAQLFKHPQLRSVHVRVLATHTLCLLPSCLLSQARLKAPKKPSLNGGIRETAAIDATFNQFMAAERPFVQPIIRRINAFLRDAQVPQ